MSYRRWRLALALAAASLLFAAVTLTQKPAGGEQGMQEKVALLKQSLAQNQAALKQYTWTETTQISLKGEVKKQEQKECRYGPDGKVQKTPIQGADQAQQTGGRRGGIIKKKIIEHKVTEMKDYMERVAALVHEYVPPDPQKIHAAEAAGNLSIQAGQGGANLIIKNYLKEGDTVMIGFDSAAKKIRSYKVQSYLDKPNEDVVTLAVDFASLPDGTNYPQQSVLDAPGKQIQVKVTNSGYKKVGQ
jgi:hypothetical protein